MHTRASHALGGPGPSSPLRSNSSVLAVASTPTPRLPRLLPPAPPLLSGPIWLLCLPGPCSLWGISQLSSRYQWGVCEEQEVGLTAPGSAWVAVHSRWRA